MDFEVGVVAVRLAFEQGVDLAAIGFRQQHLQRREAFAFRIGVVLAFAQFDQRDRVIEIAIELRKRSETVLKLVAFAHDFLRGVGIGPERRVLDARIQFREAAGRSIDVKDASSAGRATA